MSNNENDKEYKNYIEKALSDVGSMLQFLQKRMDKSSHFTNEALYAIGACEMIKEKNRLIKELYLLDKDKE